MAPDQKKVLPRGSHVLYRFFLAHLSLWLMVGYCDRSMSGIRRGRQASTIASKDISSITTVWIWTKLDMNNPYIALFNNRSNGFNPLHI